MPKESRQFYNEQGTSTRAVVSFHSDDNFDGTIYGAHPVLGQIIGVNTTKSFGGASGTFSITIKKPSTVSTSWTRLFSNPEGTWVRITYLVDGEEIPVLWGMVDSIAEGVTRSDNGARAETYTVTGRDLGKVFEDSKTIVNLFAVNNIDIMSGIYQAANLQPPIGTADEIVRQVIDLWLGNNGLSSKQYRFPKSLADVANVLSFYESLNFATIQDMDEGNGITEAMSIISPDQQSGASLWDILQQYCNGVLNEMWVDLAPNPQFNNQLRPAFYLRERVFRTENSTSRWDQTRVRKLRKGDVRNRNLAKGGAANRYNYWMISGGVLGDQFQAQAQTHSLGVTPFFPGAIPIINIESIQRHGIRPYTVTTNFLPFFKKDSGDNFVTLSANWLKRLHDWYGVAPFQLSGTLVTTRMFPEIRVGERIQEFRDEGTITYYVEGVDHQWNYPGPGTTTITVTHGEYEDVAETPIAALYKQYETPAASAAALDAMFGDVPTPNAAQTRAPLEGETVMAQSPDEKAARAKPADPKMIPGKDAMSAQAAKIAAGETVDPVPDTDVETAQQAVSLTQENLEAELPISVAENRQPKAPGEAQ